MFLFIYYLFPWLIWLYDFKSSVWNFASWLAVWYRIWGKQKRSVKDMKSWMFPKVNFIVFSVFTEHKFIQRLCGSWVTRTHCTYRHCRQDLVPSSLCRQVLKGHRNIQGISTVLSETLFENLSKQGTGHSKVKSVGINEWW